METVRAWHEAGHFIHITSHRAITAQTATEQWLERIELPYDELYCSQDKVSRCLEIGIDLLVDDSPVNITKAVDAGLAVATIAASLEPRRVRGRGRPLRRGLGGAAPGAGSAARRNARTRLTAFVQL